MPLDPVMDVSADGEPLPALDIPLFSLDTMPLADRALSHTSLTAEATLLGERFSPAWLARIKKEPTRLPEGAFGFIAPYGVVVLFGASPEVRTNVLATLAPHVVGAVDQEETESLVLQRSQHSLHVHDGIAHTDNITLGRCDVVATALSQSVALAHRERSISSLLQQAEGWARMLAETGRVSGRDRALIKSIGATLKNRFRFLQDVALDEKPDVAWDRPDLDRLYSALRHEYELAERDTSFDRKMDLLDDTARMLVELSVNRRSLRLEWLIIILIAVEVVIMVAERFKG